MTIRTRSRAGIIVLALTLTAAALPSSKPEEVGLSSERLQRINQLVQRYIDDGQITGAVTMVSRRGRIAHFEAIGHMDLESKAPMRKDGIFRIASMSKPITGVAILMLMEEGKVRLNDPVSRFIPEFKGSKVAVGREGEASTVAAEREITIRDLMTHTSGLESGGAGTREGMRIAPRSTSSTLAAYIPTLGTRITYASRRCS